MIHFDRTHEPLSQITDDGQVHKRVLRQGLQSFGKVKEVFRSATEKTLVKASIFRHSTNEIFWGN